MRAQVLREWQASAEAGATPVFILPDQPASEAGAAGKGPWRQADVRRAIAAARKTGLQDFRIEIAPDGTIAIVVECPADRPGDPGRGS